VKALFITLLVMGLPAQAQMYKCVDARGKIQYTDKPLEGCKESDIKGSPSLSGELRPPPQDLPKEDADLKRRLIENEQAARKEREERVQLAARCARLRSDLQFYSAGGRIASMNAQGEREYMDDATREKRIAALRDQLRLCP
jgi:hypothetical protein